MRAPPSASMRLAKRRRKRTSRMTCFRPSPPSTASARRTPSPCSPAPTRSPAQGRDIINLGIGQPDFRTPEHIVEAAVKALRDGHHGYTPAIGIPPLREAVARRTLADDRRRGLARPGADRAGRQGDDVRRHPDVRRAGRRHPLSGPRLSDLPLDDRVHRRAARCRCRSARRTASPSRPRRRSR